MTESLWGQIIQSTKSVTRLSKVITGSVVAVLLISTLLYWADVSAVIVQIRTGDNQLVMGAVLMTGMIIISRTMVASLLYSAIIEQPIDNRFYVGYPVVGLFRAVLPGGYITGSVVSAYVLGRSLDKKVGPLLIALTVSEIIHTVASLVFFLVGFTLLNETTLISLLDKMPRVLILLLLIVALLGVFLIRQRKYIRASFRSVINYWVEKSAMFKQYVQLDHLGGKKAVDAFSLLSSHLYNTKRAILYGGVFAMIAQAAVVMALYMSVHAVGESMSIIVAIVVLLPSRLGGLGFLPGGLGGVESALTALLIVFTDFSREGATAGTILYRATTFWVEAFVGTISIIILSVVHTTSE